MTQPSYTLPNIFTPYHHIHTSKPSSTQELNIPWEKVANGVINDMRNKFVTSLTSSNQSRLKSQALSFSLFAQNNQSSIYNIYSPINPSTSSTHISISNIHPAISTNNPSTHPPSSTIYPSNLSSSPNPHQSTPSPHQPTSSTQLQHLSPPNFKSFFNVVSSTPINMNDEKDKENNTFKMHNNSQPMDQPNSYKALTLTNTNSIRTNSYHPDQAVLNHSNTINHQANTLPSSITHSSSNLATTNQPSSPTTTSHKQPTVTHYPSQPHLAELNRVFDMALCIYLDTCVSFIQVVS